VSEHSLPWRPLAMMPLADLLVHVFVLVDDARRTGSVP
jgi:hypothetical protein